MIRLLILYQAKVSTKATPDQIWPLFTDFFNFHKWFPGLPTRYGTNGEPSCVQYCAGFSLSACDPNEAGDDGDGHVKWSKEKLTVVDPERRSLTYEMSRRLWWVQKMVSSFAVDPVEGWSLDEMVKRYELGPPFRT